MATRTLADWDDNDLVALLRRDDLPSAFERWEVSLSPGVSRPTSPEEWAGAIVLVARGRLGVDCHARGHHTFAAGDVLVLGWLPLQQLHNAGHEPVRLVAIRRRTEARDETVHRGLLRVIRHIRQQTDAPTP